ncbi:MAG: hypothetical protein EAZ95_13195 [Bacteroidetes bacterium]|nr:MAG: hypothetical protein EAZ95_13195 [Bacteroidota bacterium]
MFGTKILNDMQHYLKASHEYWLDAQYAGLAYFQHLPTEAKEGIYAKVKAKHKPVYAQNIIENQQDGDGLRGELLMFLLDCVSTAEALGLLRCEIWAKFASFMPSQGIGGRQELAYYYEEYLTRIERYMYKSLWFVTDIYTQADLQMVWKVEKYYFLRLLQIVYKGYEADLPTIKQAQEKVSMSLYKSFYTLDFLQIRINMRASDETEEVGKKAIRESVASIEKIWQQNEATLAYPAQQASPFALLLQERLAEIQLQITEENQQALMRKQLSEHDLATCIQQYKQANKLKNRNTTELTIEMQGGTLKMKISSRNYWQRVTSLGFLGISALCLYYLPNLTWGGANVLAIFFFLLAIGMIVYDENDSTTLPPYENDENYSTKE